MMPGIRRVPGILLSRRLLIGGLVWVIVGCGSGAPDSAAGLVDLWEAEGLASCTDRREPVPDVITCVDPDGDLTVGLTDTAEDTIRSTAQSASGPWIAGDGYVVITYDDDLARVQALRDALGEGRVVGVDDDGEPVDLD